MVKKRLYMVALMIFVFVMLAACSGKGKTASGSEKPIVIKFSHVSADSSVKGKGANLFRDLVAKRLGGRVKVEVYPSGSLYDDTLALDALQQGNLQMMAPISTRFVTFNPKFNVFALPYIFKDNQAVLNFSKADVTQKLYETLEKQNIKMLKQWVVGFTQYTNSKHPIDKPGDIKGVKFRVAPGDIFADHYIMLGGGAANLPLPDTYLALQQGTVDGQDNPLSNVWPLKIHEVQKYMTISNAVPVANAVITNTKFWNELPADIRSELDKIMDEVSVQVAKWSDELDAEYLKSIQASGKTQVKILTDKERQAFSEALKPLYDKYETILGKELMDAAKK